MWIRSQDMTRLFMSYGMCIDEFDGEFVISDTGGLGRCATYSTKEKALKVLDEIQTCIMTEHHYHTDDANCTRRFFTKEWKEIYQMPLDEDVEV